MVKFLVGLFVGGFIGVMMMALCVASGNAERESEMMTVINHEKERKLASPNRFPVSLFRTS